VSKSDTKETREVKLEVRLPKTGFPKTLYFNRFKMDRENGFCLIQFGLVPKSGLLIDHYSCVLPQATLTSNEKPLLGYLGRIGPSTIKHEPLQGLPPGAKADVVDIVSMAYQNDIAETCFYTFSMAAAARNKPSGDETEIEAQPLVLLRSTLELQKQFIRALYEE
jgi:hypothetical protein